MIEEQEQNEETTAETAPEAPAEEAPAEEAAPEAAADESPAPSPEPAGEDAEEALGPKERRKRARATGPAEARPERTPEERAQERAERRKRAAAMRRSWRNRQRQKRAGRDEAPRPQVEPQEHGPGRPRVRQGVVVSDKPDKTITVRIDLTRRHRVYKKVVRETSTLHAHDERNEAHQGDTVRVVESRPLSRTKRWRLLEVLERAR
jgi:small subunit ribosomal protein S17